MDFDLRSSISPPTVHLVISGELDIFTAQEVSIRLDEAMRAGCRYVVADVGALVFVDASGLGMLQRARRMAETLGGSLEFVAVSEPFRRLCRLTGLDGVFRLPVAGPGSSSNELQPA